MVKAWAFETVEREVLRTEIYQSRGKEQLARNSQKLE